MKAVLATLLGVAFAQYHPTCEYHGGPNGRYLFNLTSISGYHLEYSSSTAPGGHAYYYTPCTNNERCQQGNAEFYANAVQYNPGANTCNHYLAIDHHQSAQYVQFFSFFYLYSYIKHQCTSNIKTYLNINHITHKIVLRWSKLVNSIF